jgi:hypothetical protein
MEFCSAKLRKIYREVEEVEKEKKEENYGVSRIYKSSFRE